ncbi:hypothetical protein BDC45DRAFT_517545 [Circinella umbellata]|nr:hypothetical protein BDC45DRAFT_517545 [Circinella umbellata]
MVIKKKRNNYYYNKNNEIKMNYSMFLILLQQHLLKHVHLIGFNNNNNKNNYDSKSNVINTISIIIKNTFHSLCIFRLLHRHHPIQPLFLQAILPQLIILIISSVVTIVNVIPVLQEHQEMIVHLL